jgi:hypothetical protein
LTAFKYIENGLFKPEGGGLRASKLESSAGDGHRLVSGIGAFVWDAGKGFSWSNIIHVEIAHEVNGITKRY